MHQALRRRLLAGWARIICRRPWAVLILAAVTAAASVWVTAARLTFQADRNALITPDLEWNQRFEAWRDSFPGTEDLYAVIDAGPGELEDHPRQDQAAREAVRELATRLETLRQEGLIERAVWGFTPDQVSARAMRLLPMPEFEARLGQVGESGMILESPTPHVLIDQIVAQVRTQTSAQAQNDPLAVSRARRPITDDQGPADGDETQRMMREAAGMLTAVMSAMAYTLEKPPEERPTFGEMVQRALEPTQYLVSDNGRLYFVRITPSIEEGSINALQRSIAAVRRAVQEVDIAFSDLEMGLTGIEVIEADETEQATWDSMVASVAAVVLIAILLIAAFHSWRTPLLAIAALLVGIAWSFGFLTLTIGHLQILSVVFTVILMGLGIAYGIHLAARFEIVRHRYRDTLNGFELALRDSFDTVGPGIVTGAVTTAAAFLTTLFTDFTGMAEMGLIASGGIMLCLLSMFSVFPALLRIVKPRHRDFVPMQDRQFHMFEERWVTPFVTHPRRTIAGAAAVTLVALACAAQMRFDYDLMKLYPDDMPSVEWQRRIARDGGESVWTGTVIAKNLTEARALTELLRKQPMVEEVRGIGLLFPRDEAEKLALLAPVRERVAPMAERVLAESEALPPGDPRTLTAKLTVLNLAVGFFAASVPDSLRPAVAELSAAMQRVITVLNALSPEEREARAASLMREYRQWRAEIARDVREAVDGQPLAPGDLPGALLAPYVADRGPLEGQFALEIVPRIPAEAGYNGPLDRGFLPGFVEMLTSIDPQATGVTAQIYYSGALIERSYMLAGLYALVAVFLLMALDFQSFRDAAFCLVPVAIGFAITFAVMWLIGMSINFANIMVLPLMFGIGVDSGVHVLHRYRQDPDGHPPGLTLGTGKGITITSFTAIIGFGTLMFAGHRGISSLGFVMTLGIALTMLACWIVVPAWLAWRGSRWQIED